MLDHNGPGHFGSSFALGFSEPNFVEKPTHPHQGRGSWRPNPRMRLQIQGGRGQAAQASGGHPGWEGDPWAAQAALGASGYVTVEDLADRWDTPAAARENCPPGPGIPGWGERVQCPPSSGSPGGDQPGKASRMLTWPFMEPQGSDGHLKKQWRLIVKGELGYIPAKHIVSALPEEGERPSSTHKKITVDGWDREDEEEARSHPTSRRQHQTFRTTLLMCTAALPQFGNLKVTKAELDDWYDWFYGEDIAGRRPPPMTPPCCLQSAMRGGRSTRWCTKAPPSPMPSRISGATSRGL